VSNRSPILLSTFFLICSLLIASPVEASVSYTIKKGDTLARIAKKYHVSAKKLERSNTVSARHLKPGTKIVIPVDNAAVKKNDRRHRKDVRVDDAASSAAEMPDEAASAAIPAVGDFYHTVRRGDTLSALSKKYAIPVSEIKELNNLKSSRLKIGRILLVKRIGPKTYIVKRGDTLLKIAKKFGMDTDELMELNELDSPTLTAGQKLYLEQETDPAAAPSREEVANDVEKEIREASESEEFSEKPVQDKLIVFAKKLIDIPYKFGGNSILGIDCSAFVKKVYGFLGIDLPRTAREQFKTGETVERDNLSIGDLVFFRTYASFPSHVGIYLGNDLFIHASSKGRRVRINSLDTPYYFKRFIGARRLLPEETADTTPQS
jgi:peptidoglycan endopeptidase LytE